MLNIKSVSYTHLDVYKRQDYVQQSRMVYDYQPKTQKVAVNKTRKKTMYRDKQIFKYVTKKRLMANKFETDYKKVVDQIDTSLGAVSYTHLDVYKRQY